MTIERTQCIIQRPAWGAFVPAGGAGRTNLMGQQEMKLQALPYYDTTHQFEPVPGEDYTYFCKFCLGRTTEANYRAIIDGEINTLNLAKEPMKE